MRPLRIQNGSARVFTVNSAFDHIPMKKVRHMA